MILVYQILLYYLIEGEFSHLVSGYYPPGYHIPSSLVLVGYTGSPVVPVFHDALLPLLQSNYILTHVPSLWLLLLLQYIDTLWYNF